MIRKCAILAIAAVTAIITPVAAIVAYFDGKPELGVLFAAVCFFIGLALWGASK